MTQCIVDNFGKVKIDVESGSNAYKITVVESNPSESIETTESNISNKKIIKVSDSEYVCVVSAESDGYADVFIPECLPGSNIKYELLDRLVINDHNISSIMNIDPFEIKEAPLPFWIENYDTGSYNIWTKIDLDPNETLELVVSKTAGCDPNGDEVFDFFDDFDDNSLDINKWSETENLNGSYSFVDKTFSNSVYTAIAWASYFSTGASGSASYTLTTKNPYSGIFEAFVDLRWYSPGGYAYYKVGTQTIKQVSGGDSWSSHSTGFTFYSNLVNESSKIEFSGYTDTVDYGTHGGFAIDWVRVRKYTDQEPTVTVEQVDPYNLKVRVEYTGTETLKGYQIKIPAPNGFISSKNEKLRVSVI